MIVLVGFMGAGKTTIGHLLSAGLGLPFADSDLVIEGRAGRPVRQIFAEDGEPAFRAIEHETIAGLLRGPETVLAVGGGAAEQQATRLVLRGHDVVYLHVSYAEAMLRVGGDAGRPMLRKPGLAGLYRRRMAAYESVATLTVPTDGRDPAAISQDIIAALATRATQATRAAPDTPVVPAIDGQQGRR